MEQLNSVIFQSNARLSGLTKHLNTSKGKDNLLFTSTRWVQKGIRDNVPFFLFFLSLLYSRVSSNENKKQKGIDGWCNKERTKWWWLMSGGACGERGTWGGHNDGRRWRCWSHGEDGRGPWWKRMMLGWCGFMKGRNQGEVKRTSPPVLLQTGFCQVGSWVWQSEGLQFEFCMVNNQRKKGKNKRSHGLIYTNIRPDSSFQLCHHPLLKLENVMGRPHLQRCLRARKHEEEKVWQKRGNAEASHDHGRPHHRMLPSMFR